MLVECVDGFALQTLEHFKIGMKCGLEMEMISTQRVKTFHSEII